jgi:3-dehydroquinate dehydratase/shikimate dehydrogenase
MREASPALVKIAVTARRPGDCLTLRDAVRDAGPRVAIAMGPAGLLTRACPWLLESRWAYAGSAAPGQLPLDALVDTYRVRSTSAATAVYAIVGSPLAHSASPAMHNPAFAANGLDAVYVPIETTDVAEFFAVADAIGIVGASVTAPLKSAFGDDFVTRDEMARRIGAVNTLRRRAGRWEATNFDVAGFIGPFERRGSRLAGRRAVVLGAGGAARAAGWALRAQGARVEISARRHEEAAQLARELHAVAVAWPPEPGWDVLVNATPVGTWPEAAHAPIDRARVRGGLVYDLVYNPPDTTLLRWAREAGAETLSGLEMLVGQACRQFEWWTGQAAPVATIERGAAEFVHRHR